MKNGKKGFSLIELVAVVAIILIIAAIAIPNLLQARVSANESSAVTSIQTINTAMTAYNWAHNDLGYAATLSVLGGTNCNPPDATSACLIDTVLAAGTKDGYSFSAAAIGPPPAEQYFASAVPMTGTGNRSFCTTEMGGIHFDATGAAIADHDACLALPGLQ
jgi:prepilin-type N-terminal cleavage/methylation domain-containing protein